ncbi:MAG: hypothetical protein ACLGXA_02605 [Acidobacteriota bacterium]
MAGALLLIPPAIAAGLGELGKHGSLISPRFGAGVPLAGITTDMPLLSPAPQRFGADEFCAHCQVCTQACPPGAITPRKQMVRGVERWYVDFDKCIPILPRLPPAASALLNIPGPDPRFARSCWQPMGAAFALAAALVSPLIGLLLNRFPPRRILLPAMTRSTMAAEAWLESHSSSETSPDFDPATSLRSEALDHP